MKAVIKPILYTSKVLASGESPIRIRVCMDGKRKYTSLRLSCKEIHWDKKRGLVKKNHPQSNNINTIIKTKLNELEKKALDFERDNVEYSADYLLNCEVRKEKSNLTFHELLDQFIDDYKANREVNTYKRAITFRNTFKRFQTKDIELFRVDNDLYISFYQYLKELGIKDTTINIYINYFKTCWNWGLKKGYIKNKITFFINGKLNKKTKKRALGINEVHLLIKHLQSYNTLRCMIDEKEAEYIEIKDNKIVFKRDSILGTKIDTPIKNYCNNYYLGKSNIIFGSETFALTAFLLSYFLQGLSICDIAKIRWSDLKIINKINKEKYNNDLREYGSINYAQNNIESEKYYMITTYRNKTHANVKIYIKVLDLHGIVNPLYNFKIDYSGYLLPILNGKGKDLTRITSATRGINIHLRDIARKLKINNFTMYAARHTYATQLYYNHIDKAIIAQAMGRTTKDIETYFKDFNEDDIIEANETIHLFDSIS